MDAPNPDVSHHPRDVPRVLLARGGARSLATPPPRPAGWPLGAGLAIASLVRIGTSAIFPRGGGRPRSPVTSADAHGVHPSVGGFDPPRESTEIIAPWRGTGSGARPSRHSRPTRPSTATRRFGFQRRGWWYPNRLPGRSGLAPDPGGRSTPRRDRNLARGGVGQSRHGEHHASLRQRRLELAPLPNRRLIGTLLVLVGTLVRVTIGTLVLVPILSVAAGARAARRAASLAVAAAQPSPPAPTRGARRATPTSARSIPPRAKIVNP